jgi:hypothetical protein
MLRSRGVGATGASGIRLGPIFRCAKATIRAASGHPSIYNRAHPKKMGQCAALHVARSTMLLFQNDFGDEN